MHGQTHIKFTSNNEHGRGLHEIIKTCTWILPLRLHSFLQIFTQVQ